jgi:SAM-dependent methyltransferase
MNIEKKYVNCDICGGDKNKILFSGGDFRFGRGGLFNIVQCDRCGLIYLNPRPTAESMLRLYKENYTPDSKPYILPFIETSKLKIILKRLWHQYVGGYHDNLIKKLQGKVLDIGCGNGNFLFPIKQNGGEVYGIEINPVSARYCNEARLNVFCGVLEDARFSDNFFDTVILSHVIEHLPSPKKTLKEIYRILKSSGKLYIFSPNSEGYMSKLFGKYWHGWHIPFHFYCFTLKSIKSLTKEVGFEIIKIRTITSPASFTISLKSSIWGKHNGIKLSDKGKFFDSLFFQAFISLFLRVFDFVLKGKGDCLEVEFLKVK